ncbi:hypothetical protein C8Q77DRAFT_1214425 [Trametes polyzona]|nr:hypothetical protein C8Q77DRAFT_1214425 [Trametes polyzona]
MTLSLPQPLRIIRLILFRMAVFVWGFVWLLMSVLTFLAGRFIPRLQSKPPPLAPLPRSPRVRSAPVSPVVSPPKSIASEPDEAVSNDTSITVPLRSASASALPGTSTKRKILPKKKWSLPTRFFPRKSAPSPKSSLFSDGSATLVGSPSPPQFFPDLPLAESATPSSELEFALDPLDSSRSSPAPSPHVGRSARLPGAKAFKSLSLKISTKKSPAARTQSHSPCVSEDALPSREGSVDYNKTEALGPHRASTVDASRPARPGHLLHQRNMSLPGEVFTTSFVNPFRSRSQKPKTAPEPESPSPKRPFTPRRMLTSFQLALTSPSTRSNSHSQSRRSSVSSTSTAVSALSAPSVLSGASSSPRSVPRTQPYAAPYFAPMPGSGFRPASKGKAKPRRASSLSPPRRPETVAEESADEQPLSPTLDSESAPSPQSALGLEGTELSPLGLKLGQLGHGRPKWLQREGRHRVAVSESAIQRAESAASR